jgi:hypothetical protein
MERKPAPEIEPIAFLLGTWQGEGKGSYPTIEPFSYLEEVRFWHTGKPFLFYQQKTTHPVKGFPMHAETGYWRPLADGRIEILFIHPTGIAEIQEGTVDGRTIDVASSTVAKTTTAKEVTTMERTFTVDGDLLQYEVRMAAVGVPLTHHLAAELKRTS